MRLILIGEYMNRSITLSLAAITLLFAPALQAQTYPSVTYTQTAQAKTGTIVDIASSNPNFTTLVKALQAAGLVETLSGGNFTVFAPTNEAFAALPPGTVEKLLQPENREGLKKILLYHVVPGSLKAASLQSGQVKTVEGNSVGIKISGNSVTVNDAKVVSTDIVASNGVIHVIDKILLPPGLLDSYRMSQQQGYLGIGGAIGLSGNTTALGTGGFAILSKTVFTDNLSLHDATIVFGSATASSNIALTVDFPIRDEATGRIIISPFLGGGILVRDNNGLTISPLATIGLDLPLSKDFTGTLRVNAGFPSDRQVDVGILAGIGFNFSLF
jgi:uncharacterized surface protein with fasciclin (FAS1) repeats